MLTNIYISSKPPIFHIFLYNVNLLRVQHYWHRSKICILKPELWSHNFLPFTRRARYHWRELKPWNLRLPTLECCGSLCGLDCDLWGATTLLFSYKCVHHYVAFASFPLVSKAYLCVLLSLSFFSSSLKTWKDSCKSLHLCFSWIEVVFLSPIFMISQHWYRYRQQILCCLEKPMHELDCCLGEIYYFCNIMALQHVWWWTGNCPHLGSILAHAAIIMGVYCIEVSWVLNWFCTCNKVGGRNLTVIQLCMQIALNLLLGALHEALRTLKGEKLSPARRIPWVWSWGLSLRKVP